MTTEGGDIMTLGERIKEVRKSLKLTQREFADKLKLKQNSIAQVEGGRNTSDQTIRMICQEFNVSEKWLRTGEEPMFVPKKEDALDELVKQKHLSDSDRILIEKFLNLKPTERESVIRYITDLAEKINEATALETAEETAPVPEEYVQEARAEADAVGNQVFKELLQEKKQVAEFSASQGDTGKKAI